MIRFERKFLPAQQGAFYTESIFCDEAKFNIIYDCGSEQGIQYINTVIDNSFTKEENIDILFISHFHNDHTNGIPHLLDYVNVRNIVIPYLNSYYIKANLIDLYLEGLDDSFAYNFLLYLYRNFNDNEESYNSRNGEERDGNYNLEKRLKDISIHCSVSNIIESNNVRRNNIHIIDNKDINKLINNCNFWEFITYNSMPKGNSLDEFINAFPIEFFYEFKKNKKNAYEKYEKEITDAYNSLRYSYSNHYFLKKIINNDLNKTSMLLYSGPIDNKMQQLYCCSFKRYDKCLQKNYYKNEMINSQIIHCSSCCCKKCKQTFKTSCLYTGDFNLNADKRIRDIIDFYENYRIDRVGILQVPHHGSRYNFKMSKFFMNHFINCSHFVMSTNKISHNHPSEDLLIKIRNNQCFSHIVNDKKVCFKSV